MTTSYDKIFFSVKTLKTLGPGISIGSDDFNKNRINNKNHVTNLFSVDDYFKKNNCTIFYLGSLPILQKCFICSICNPHKDKKYICEYCYLNCHNLCREVKKKHLYDHGKEFKFVYEQDYIGMKEFFCICGQKYKHTPPESLVEEYGACNLLQLDTALKLDDFFCETHKIQICCVCSVKCHNKCKIKKTKTYTNIMNMNSRKNRRCNCAVDENHTKYNEVAFTFPLDKYQNLSGINIWPVQILNILFKKRGILDELTDLFISNLESETNSEKDKNKFRTLLESFSNTFNRKFKTFYYTENILEMFKFIYLKDYISKIQLSNMKAININNNIILKFRLIFVLLFVHLRRDFQTVKCLTSIDFLCSSILERIKYKIILGNKTIYNEHIYTKYSNKKLMVEGNVLKEIALKDVCSLMEISFKYIDLKAKAYEFEVCLKYLCFILKKMLFTRTELIKLSHCLINIFKKFHEYIETKKPNLKSILNIFQGLAEIVLIFSVSYNDLVILDYLKKYKYETQIKNIKSIDDFIHIKSACGNALFKIIIMSCDFIKKHYECLSKKNNENEDNDNVINFHDKIINLFTETLGIFCLADNFYYKQICDIKEEDLIDFFHFKNKLEKNLWVDFYLEEKNNIEKLLLQLKNGIEYKFNYLFTSSYNEGRTLKINKIIYEDIFDFSKDIYATMNRFIIRMNFDINNNTGNNGVYFNFSLRRMTSYNTLLNTEYNLLNNQNNGINNTLLTNNIDDETEVNNKRKKRINNYLKKLSLKEQNYQFLKEVTNYKILEEFVELLIVSNIDETLGKILSFLSNRKFPNLLTQELCDIIYSTLRLYFYSKNGMKYFLMGKNLTRINKVINRFNFNSNNKNFNSALGKNIDINLKIMTSTLDFLLDICKGINIYDLSIKNHKVLPRLKKNLLEHIIVFNSLSSNYLLLFSLHFKKILKIFFCLRKDFGYEEYENIKKEIIFIFDKNNTNLFNKNAFFQILNLAQSKENLNYISQNDPNNTNKKLFLSLYFTFFKLFTFNTFYFYNNKETNKILNIFYNFNDLNQIKQAFASNTFTLKQKYILLEYLRTIYFSDYLDEYDIFKQITPLSSNEFEILLKNNLINTYIKPDNINNESNKSLKGAYSGNNIYIDNVSQNELLKKYKRINDLKIVLEIFVIELSKFPEQIYGNKIEHCELFYKQILLDIKYISNFFYCQQKNILGELKIYFYQLAFIFLQKADNFYQIYQKIKKGYKTNLSKIILEIESTINTNINSDIDGEWNEESKKIKEKIENMKSISFNIYDNGKIYYYLNESIDTLIKLSKINNKYNLQNYLEHYDVMAEANFTPFSLLETLDYEYFYDELVEESNKIIQQNYHLYKIENLKNSYMNTFIDINNTNFLNLMTNISEDNHINNYRAKYIEYFLSFMNSSGKDNIRRLEINLCILTKLMFYDSEEMQNIFSTIKNDYFFLNLNYNLNKYSVLVFSLSKNIFAFDMAQEITNINKLLMQFIQALGEGFNFDFHDNIFNCPILKKNMENNINTINRDSMEKYEEEKNQNEINNNLYDIDNDNSRKLKTVYASIINNLKYALYKLDLDNLIDCELPYDKLIIFISNAIDFIIEYIVSTDNNNLIIELCFKLFFFGVKIKNIEEYKKEIINSEKFMICYNPYLKLFFSNRNNREVNNPSFAIQRKKIICYTKIKLSQMITYYLLTGGKEAFVQKLVSNYFSTVNLYSEILYNFNDLINHLGIKNPALLEKLKKEESVDGYTNKLIDFYTYEEDFRNMIELQLIFDLYIIIKLLEEIYKYNQLIELFEKSEEVDYKNTFDENGEFNLRSRFSKSVYKFLNIIVLKVLIKVNNEEDEDNGTDSEDDNDDIKKDYKSKNPNVDIISKKAKYLLKRDKNFYNLMNLHKEYVREKNKKKERKEDSFALPIPTADSENSSSYSSDEEDEDKNSNIKTIFFPRPFLTFFLSKSTKLKFNDIVDRSSNSSKKNSLLEYADYSLFEMIINMHLIDDNKLSKFFANINYRYIEIINYFFIVIQNILILFRFYKASDNSYEEYYTFDSDRINKLYHENMVLAVLQIFFLAFFLIIWYYFKFINSCQYNIMREFNKPFVRRRNGEDQEIPQTVVDYFQGKNVGNLQFFKEINKKLSNWKIFYAIVVPTHLMNREIIMLVLSLILSIIFLGTKLPLFLIVQILFIINIISTLFDIVLAIKLKWKNIILLLIFDFLCIYVSMWFSFLYFSYFFVFDDVLIPASQETISEGYCFSSVQCYLFMLQRGSLSNGGISNDIGMVSYKSDVGFFIGRYFFDVIFFLLISLYIGKMFLSFIIDTFGELRDINDENTDDKKNVCFICQIERDECLLKNIDFDHHVTEVHNVWNYIYFLNYLYVNNPLNFNSIENSVWENLKEQGINWFPQND